LIIMTGPKPIYVVVHMIKLALWFSFALR